MNIARTHAHVQSSGPALAVNSYHSEQDRYNTKLSELLITVPIPLIVCMGFREWTALVHEGYFEREAN
jgi:hypothetical protein